MLDQIGFLLSLQWKSGLARRTRETRFILHMMFPFFRCTLSNVYNSKDDSASGVDTNVAVVARAGGVRILLRDDYGQTRYSVKAGI